jgi:nucleotide-binding universal stress UspA family protein
MRILIPTDFSSNALHAAAYAVHLFGRTDVTYILLHAQYDAGYAGAMGYSMGPELFKASQEGLDLAAERFAKSTGATSVETGLAFGFLSTVVNDFVKERGADAVVMGKRGETASALFGSNTTAVLSDCPVPVVAVPDHARLRAMRRVLLAADHREVEAEPLSLLRNLALKHGAHVLVTHIAMDAPTTERARFKKQYQAALKDVDLDLLEGYGHDVVDGLVRTARSKKADVIAILHRQIGFFARLFNPSVAKELALESDLPLLVLQDRPG